MKIVATLTIHGAAEMTEGGRLNVAGWMIREAKALLARSKRYAGNYSARYVVAGPKPKKRRISR
jgi:hypothetical protein